MDGHYSDKYAFLGEWYDNEASQLRKFNVFYYPNDDTIEMYDLKLRKIFLRRVKVAGVALENFYIGATLHILGRLVKIVDFRCEDTKRKLQKDMEVTFALSKPMSDSTLGKIISVLLNNGLRITKMKKSLITVENLNQIYRYRMTDASYPFLIEYMQGHYLYGMELVGKNAVDLLKQTLGDPEPSKAAPGTVRALYGQDLVHNCIHESASIEIALEDIQYFFDATTMRLTPTLSNCTMCVVKPHALRERKLGLAIQLIDEAGFNITALNMFTVEKVNAGEFYEVYKGIVPEYKGMVEELASGSCIGMEIVCKDKSKNSAIEFRKFVGPTDPEIARLLRPHTLRAKLGVNKVKNAIHCSDLPEDGLLEVEYFFKILEL